jgi:hypothetical protein
MRQTVFALLLIVAVVPSASAQEKRCLDPAVIDTCTVGQVVDQLGRTEVSLNELEFVRITRRVQQAVAAQPTATTAPQASGAQIHASRENFNIPLSAAINTVNRADDEQSLVVRFNQANAGPITAGFTGTITKPSLYKSIEKSIEETRRKTTAEALSEKLEDADDISLAVSLTPATPTCDADRLRRGDCYGRDPEAYISTLGRLLVSTLGDAGRPSDETNTILFTNIRDLVLDLPKQNDTLFGSLGRDEKEQLLDLIEALKISDLADTAREVKARTKRHVKNLATLVGNQPQWTLTGVWRFRDDLVGPDVGGLELKYERGLVNVNTVANDCRGDQTCLANALKNVDKTDSFSIVLSARQLQEYEFLTLPLQPAEGQTLPQFDAVTSDRVREYTARAQYGFDLAATVNEVPIRFDAAASWSQVQGDPERDKTRYVGSVTLTIPLTEDVLFPVTVDYANRPEFLKSQKNLGIHFGVTYRIPFGKPK